MEACKKLINHLQKFESSFLSEGMSWAEYAEEEEVDIVDELQISDWQYLSAHHKEYTSPVQAMLASVAQDFTVEKAPYSLKIITEVLLSNNPYNYEICSEFSFNLISFSRQRNEPWFWRSITKDYVEQTEGFEYKYTQSLKTIFNSQGEKKHPIAKEYLTAKVANIFKEYFNHKEYNNAHYSWMMQYTVLYINNLQFDNHYANIKKIAKQAIDRDKFQNENQLILLDDLGFIYVRDLNYMLFVSYADVLAIEAVKIPFNKYAIHQEGLLFQTLYVVDIISYEAKGFDNLVKMTDILFNISVKNHIFGQEVPYKKQFWLRRKLKYQVYNAHLVKNYTKKEKIK